MFMTNRKVRSGVALLAVAAVGVLGSPLAASAASINVPAITFVPRGNAPAGDVLLGLLANNGDPAVYYAFAPLTAGENVCKVLLWARDNDGDFNITARLVRKQLVSGPGTGFGPPPQVMATATTTGGNADLQKILTTAITNPLVTIGFLYWIELDFPGGFMEALSVRIITQQVC
jgi:hypothetical protein